jgi:hypothetical protein
MFNERNNAQSGALAAELLRHYLSQEAVPGIERELPLARQLLQTITREEVSAYARQVLPDNNRVVLASTPQKPGLAPVTRMALSDARRAFRPRSRQARSVRAGADGPADRGGRCARGANTRDRRDSADLSGASMWPAHRVGTTVIFSSYARGGVARPRRPYRTRRQLARRPGRRGALRRWI